MFEAVRHGISSSLGFRHSPRCLMSRSHATCSRRIGTRQSSLTPPVFRAIADRVESEHAAALGAEGRGRAWTYSGGTDLVSFMCYSCQPDWSSLTSVNLHPLARLGGRASLSEVTEGLRRWEADRIDRQLAPGEGLLRFDGAVSLLGRRACVVSSNGDERGVGKRGIRAAQTAVFVASCSDAASRRRESTRRQFQPQLDEAHRERRPLRWLRHPRRCCHRPRHLGRDESRSQTRSNFE